MPLCLESNPVFLAQSDTTVGLLCADKKKLNAIKVRPLTQNVLLESASLEILKQLVRVPNRHKNRIRRAKQTTFIYPCNIAIRLVQNHLHLRFLRYFGTLYSTSANLTKQPFNKQWAKKHCNIIIYDSRGLKEAKASSIYKINQKRIQRRR